MARRVPRLAGSCRRGRDAACALDEIATCPSVVGGITMACAHLHEGVDRAARPVRGLALVGACAGRRTAPERRRGRPIAAAERDGVAAVGARRLDGRRSARDRTLGELRPRCPGLERPPPRRDPTPTVGRPLGSRRVAIDRRGCAGTARNGDRPRRRTRFDPAVLALVMRHPARPITSDHSGTDVTPLGRRG
jgi:hypothetical protein